VSGLRDYQQSEIDVIVYDYNMTKQAYQT